MSRWTRLRNVFRPGRVNADLDEELDFHLHARIRDLMAAGLSRPAATAEARRRLGNRLRAREESRDVKLMPWLDSIVRDVRLGVRMHRRHGLVTGAAVLSLGMALGAAVAGFSLVYALILRPLPVRQPERLVSLAFPVIDRSGSPPTAESETFNDPLFVQLREAGRGRVALMALSTQVMRPVLFEGPDGDSEQVRTQFVSSDTFDVLGVRPSAGRLLVAQDDEAIGGHPVAVVSHAFWMRRFGGDPSVLGRSFALQNGPLQFTEFQIVGIAEPRFAGVEPGRPTDVWMPYSMYNPRAFGNASFNWFRIVGRLADGVGAEQAQAALAGTFRQFREERNDLGPADSPDVRARFISAPLIVRSAETGQSPLRRQFERPLWILAIIAGLVLLIAGSNVANLLLARTAAREHEMSLRLSIGAGRLRLVQQVLIESLLLASVSTMAGLVFARAAAPFIVGILTEPGDPASLAFVLDWRMVGFVSMLTLAVTALFGLAPALKASHVAPVAALKAGGSRAVGRARAMRPFIALQVAFSVVILFVGGLLVFSFVRISGVNPGYSASNVLLLSVEPTSRVEPAERRAALFRVIDRLRAVPGVESVASADFNLVGRAWTQDVRVPNTQYDVIETTMAPVTPGFFETMRVPIVSGRSFEARDFAVPAPSGVVVSQSFARRYFGNAVAIGRMVEAGYDGSPGRQEVIGVAADSRHSLRDAPAPTLYFPMPLRANGTLHVRVAGDAAALTARLREEIRAADPLFRVTRVSTQTAEIRRTLLRERLLALLSGFFALVGLLLAAVGLYGVLTYSVVQRTREIGIRMALGAPHTGVAWTVIAEAGTTILAGAAVGLAGGYYLSRYVDALLFEVRPSEAWSLLTPLAAMLVASLLASIVPALRAARVDPVVALRQD